MTGAARWQRPPAAHSASSAPPGITHCPPRASCRRPRSLCALLAPLRRAIRIRPALCRPPRPAGACARPPGALERAGLLVANDKEQLLPGRDIGHITLLEILGVARNQRSGHEQARELSLPAVDELQRRLERARRDCCGQRTLRDLIEPAPPGPPAPPEAG